MTFYQAGGVSDPQVSATTKSSDEYTAFMLARFIEFWCQSNCVKKWRVCSSGIETTVSFDEFVDAVLFRISEFSEHVRWHFHDY